jgi:hypothetical protein
LRSANAIEILWDGVIETSAACPSSVNDNWFHQAARINVAATATTIIIRIEESLSVFRVEPWILPPRALRSQVFTLGTAIRGAEMAIKKMRIWN